LIRKHSKYYFSVVCLCRARFYIYYKVTFLKVIHRDIEQSVILDK
jgi:hypothetical protein